MNEETYNKYLNSIEKYLNSKASAEYKIDKYIESFKQMIKK